MKKSIKTFVIVIISLVSLFLIFIVEESIRIKSNSGAKPLFIVNQTKSCVSCMEVGDEALIEYKSLGYKIKVRYSISPKSTEDNKIVQVIGKEFFLFNKLRLWGWIS